LHLPEEQKNEITNTYINEEKPRDILGVCLLTQPYTPYWLRGETMSHNDETKRKRMPTMYDSLPPEVREQRDREFSERFRKNILPIIEEGLQRYERGETFKDEKSEVRHNE